MSQAVRFGLSVDDLRNSKVQYFYVVGFGLPQGRASCTLHIWIQVCFPQQSLLELRDVPNHRLLLCPFLSASHMTGKRDHSLPGMILPC